jgi:rubrerythrin
LLDEMAGTYEAGNDDDQFLGAGAPAQGAFQCAECGYGVAVQASLPRCPMCGGSAWERVLRGGAWEQVPTLTR